MVRITNGKQRHQKHKKFIRQAKGFRLGRKNVYKQVRLALVKQGQHAYIGRKEKKREMRRLWIERINAFVRNYDMKYSEFIHLLKQHNIQINRKMLSNIMVYFPEVAKQLVLKVQQEKK